MYLKQNTYGGELICTKRICKVFECIELKRITVCQGAKGRILVCETSRVL